MHRLVIGILAHVDAGKTTLSESLLYLTGTIRRLGRVDKQDAYLDTHALEKRRGITIFAKQAVFTVDNTQITLLDTPGHLDFSAEMERTLQVLDYAILVVSGVDGVQGHTKTLWQLLQRYQIPTVIFVNKMDQAGTNRDQLLADLKKNLSESCVDFSLKQTTHFYEQIALCDEKLLEFYLEHEKLNLTHIQQAIARRTTFPCYFGSALKVEGVEQLLQGFVDYAIIPTYARQFGARVFKISRDPQGNRLTHMKITGGTLQVRDSVTDGQWEDKVNQIRVYSGEKYESVSTLSAGSVCAVTGLSQTKPGQGLGSETGYNVAYLEPVLSYRIVLPADYEPQLLLPKLRELEEEEPELHVVWDEPLQEIQVQLMGEVQVEILQSRIKELFDVDITFDAGQILYKESIADSVIGVGHFEPRGHYAEVHLLLEPGAQGSGLVFTSDCSEDLLARNWQAQVLTHLQEKTHSGVLTGAPIADLKITLVAGRAHNTHTVGGDFRAATYRAVRQGLMQAKSVLLEPYYEFELHVPETMIGRAMTDIERMAGRCEVSANVNETAVLTGTCPVITMQNYQQGVTSYTSGLGRLSYRLAGYQPCHNQAEIIAASGYDPELDVENPTSSVFCVQGSGFIVPWDQVSQRMHLEPIILEKPQAKTGNTTRVPSYQSDYLDLDYDLHDQAVNANKGKKRTWNRKNAVTSKPFVPITDQQHPPKTAYLLVDGYNIIYGWPELSELADEDMESARIRLLDILCSYQSIKQCEVIVVFDAYRVVGHAEEVSDYHNIKVVFTKEAQTADAYIERFSYVHQKKYNIAVATSDALEQIIIRGSGSGVLSARDLWEEIQQAKQYSRHFNTDQQGMRRSFIGDSLTPESIAKMDALKQNEDKK